jgi:hypothetical protein
MGGGGTEEGSDNFIGRREKWKVRRPPDELRQNRVGTRVDGRRAGVEAAPD